jgi:hypothetical protein
MKKKLVVFLLCSVMALSLAACNSTGDASAESTPAQVESEPIVVASTPTETTEVTPAPTEETPTVTETPTEEATEIEEPTTTETPTEEATDESPSTPDLVDTTDQQTDTDNQQAEEPTLSAIDQAIVDNGMSAYINSNGLFDVEKYGKAIGADLSYLFAPGCTDFVYLFGNQTWFIQSGWDTNSSGTPMGFIIIGKWDTVTYPDWWNVATYSYVFDYGDEIATTGGFSIPKQVLAYLPAVVSGASGPDAAPNVPGATFRPCAYNDAFTQY